MGIWVHPYTVTPVRVGVDFRKIGAWLNPSDVVKSWLRLQKASECIPHPYWMYTKCFSTLIWCDRSYGSTLTLLGMCRWGVGFFFWGVDLSLSDVVMSWLRPQEASDGTSHIHIGCMQSVLAP